MMNVDSQQKCCVRGRKRLFEPTHHDTDRAIVLSCWYGRCHCVQCTNWRTLIIVSSDVVTSRSSYRGMPRKRWGYRLIKFLVVWSYRHQTTTQSTPMRWRNFIDGKRASTADAGWSRPIVFTRVTVISHVLSWSTSNSEVQFYLASVPYWPTKYNFGIDPQFLE